MRLHLWQGSKISPSPTDVSVDASPSGWAWQNQEPLVVNDLAAEARFPLVLNTLREQGLKSYCWLPLTTAENRLGTLGLGSVRPNAYTGSDMRLLPRVAQLIAVAVRNTPTRVALLTVFDFAQDRSALLQPEQLAQALGLSPADGDFGLLLVVHS